MYSGIVMYMIRVPYKGNGKIYKETFTPWTLRIDRSIHGKTIS